MAWATSLKRRAFLLTVALLRLQPVIAARGPAYAHIAIQLFRAGSSIGAQLEEGEVANSRRDMGAKHAIALREAREAQYWLGVLAAAEVMSAELAPLHRESGEIVAMLTASVKKLRNGVEQRTGKERLRVSAEV